jgi:sorbitol-specific phosphotransferase system component IIC
MYRRYTIHDHPVAVWRAARNRWRVLMVSLLLTGRQRFAALGSETGMSTAEYAIGTIAAAAFAAVLYAVVTGGSITQALTSLIQRALTANF